MRNHILMTSLGLAVLAGSAVAQGDMMGGKFMRPMHSFEELDANGDGKLMPDEMEAHMQTRFEGADGDGDGVLSKDELQAHIRAQIEQRAEMYASHMIDRHDANGDGALTMDEMKARHEGRMFSRMDADGDGAVSKEEFEEMRGMRMHGKHKRHGMKGATE